MSPVHTHDYNLTSWEFTKIVTLPKTVLHQMGIVGRFGLFLPVVRLMLVQCCRPGGASYGQPQVRDVGAEELSLLQPGAMYGIASKLAIEGYRLWHAFVGLDRPDRHLGVTHRGGKLVVASTLRTLERHIQYFGPSKLVYFPEAPQ